MSWGDIMSVWNSQIATAWLHMSHGGLALICLMNNLLQITNCVFWHKIFYAIKLPFICIKHLDLHYNEMFVGSFVVLLKCLFNAGTAQFDGNYFS